MTIKNKISLTVIGAVSGALMLSGIAFAAGKLSGKYEHHHHSLGVDFSHGGEKQDEHQEFYGEMEPEDQVYTAAVCKIAYVHRTPEEKTFCTDIGFPN